MYRQRFPATVRLTRPLAEFPDTFDQLNSVMELRDGRVLVSLTSRRLDMAYTTLDQNQDSAVQPQIPTVAAISTRNR